MDCPDSCALEVTVSEGRIARIQAAPSDRTAHPNTQGFICDKVGKFAQRVYHDTRILHPMRRIGPKGEARFERISWDEAIGTIVGRFRSIIAQWGAEAILPYHYDGSNGFLSHEFLDSYLWARLGTSRLARTLCAAPATAVALGMYGKMPGVAFNDFPKARAIIIWGANPKASNIHLAPYLRQAKRNGAFLAVVDPIRNFPASEIDLHLPVFPGADLPVALALIRLWEESGALDHAFLDRHADGLEPLLAAAAEWPVERAAEAARVPVAGLRELARVFAAASPAVIRVGWGTERNQNGGQALAAVLAIPALLGKFGIRGGGYTLSNSGAAKLDAGKLFGPDAPPARWATRELNMSQLGSHLTDGLAPPVKCLFVYDCNPLATVPDQNAILRGLCRDDLFTVVHEQVLTDTARYADLLLPAVTFLEQHEIKRAYGSYIVGGVQPAIEPRGEAKPNEWLFARLAQALGFTDAPFGWDTATCMEKVAGALTLHGAPCDVAAMTTGGVQGYPFSGGGPVQFGSVKPLTPDGKVHLTPAALGSAPFHYAPIHDEAFPLALVSSSNNKLISSTLGEFNYPELWLTLHPADAAARAIAEGDGVRVFNQLGEVRCRARLSDRVRPGVCALPKGAWRKSSTNGQTSTALCPAHVNVVGGGACYNDARVQVERCGS
jgi:anaerobic selenocysteine-containing dehydrogenase